MKNLFTESWVKHLAIILGILVMWQISAVMLRSKAKEIGKEILTPISKNSSIEKTGIITLSSLSAVNKNKLLNLFDRIENQKEKHRVGFLEFYPYYFASSALLLILSSLFVAVVLLTAQTGLNNTNVYLKTVFYSLAVLTSFYAISPLVFKVETNIANNLSKYIAYDNLQAEIYNYAITNSITSQKDTLSLNNFHTLVTKNMTEINSINVEFDLKVIPIPDYKKLPQ